MIHVALAGNPNTGKTSLFNILTGSYEYVGNWTGVTVEKKVGTLRNKKGELVDLPGIYSLNPLSRDEGVATQFLIAESFTSVLNIVDASQIERNLYLTVQLLEYGKPVIIGLNMMDVARGRGFMINETELSARLGVPVLPIVARTGAGCQELGAELAHTEHQQALTFALDYGPVLERAIKRLVDMIPDGVTLPKRWLAIQLFEGNALIRELLESHITAEQLAQLQTDTERDVCASSSDARSLPHYIRLVRGAFITGVMEGAVTRTQNETYTLSERIDHIVTNRVLGIPIFLLFMFLMFKLTFDWLGTPLSDQIDGFLNGTFADMLRSSLQAAGASNFIQAVVLNGIVAGVGGVLVFVPQIFILFFLISFIEDSGYMARVAMVMDRLMQAIGLNGKAFIPMIIGFGCNVPGVMAARTIEQPKERLLTILLTPLMSCSARLPVYSLFVGMFFVHNQALVVLSMYVLGVVVALLLAKLFSSTLLKQEGSMFVVELPPYRFPQWRTLLRSTWEKGKGFVKKAGTLIFGGSVAIWFLSYAGPGGLNVNMDHSFLAMIGGFLAPLFAPLGFGTWQAGASLIPGFMAKEVVVATMNIIYAAPDEGSLQKILATHFTPLSAYSFMAFILLYVPCLATVGVIRKETGSARWTWFSIGYALVIAYIIALVIYQGGRLLGLQ
ncbi:ferrous iron transport protein B [Aneurinibacillus soli]|uniref:Ferrous iron transport protein B n=1 Tax=Aneurinibacillus soli TaxID=1500254 RepID=A0A0U5BGH6_9BACL|nr:ferrous iron transport protein B [Aneurinibacillus soli]PYE59895.1 ferrous iron transport protein B [Aneurinibacillus soli]BAU29383.1 Ferrous iron transport protein B [Aneurinibacillus soli]